MAKAPKASKAPSPLALDTAVIAKDFARTANHNIDDAARAAIIRHVNDKDAFNSIRIAAQGAWAVARAAHLVATKTKGDDWTPRELSIKDATAIFDGSTRGATTTIGTKPKRDAFTQSLYEFGKVEWSRYLAANAIVTLNPEKQTRTPRQPETTPSAEVNPLAPDAFLVVETAATFADVLAQARKPEAFLSKLVNAHSKVIKGDAGARLRDLAKHVKAELDAIAKL